MTTPTFSDGPPVPLMVEGLLDAAALRQLFADLTTEAVMLGVREKGGPADFAAVDELPPAVALERLLSGAARAVQVRYQYDGHLWTDTILTTSAGFRVVRCRHDSEA